MRAGRGRGVVSVTVSLSVWPSGPRATRTARDRSPDTRDARVSRDTATRETDRAARGARYGATRDRDQTSICRQLPGGRRGAPAAEQNNLACGPIGISFIPYAVLEFACHEQRHGRLSQKFAALQRQAQSVLAWLIVPW